MEAHNEFLRSLKELARLVTEIVRRLDINEDQLSQLIKKAGLGDPVYRRILAANLSYPLDQIMFGNLVRVFQLKDSTFIQSPDFTQLKELWKRTKQTHSLNGGSPQSITSEDNYSPGKEFSQKKKIAWILSVLWTKLLRAGLLDRGKFQKRTGVSRGFIEEIIHNKREMSNEDPLCVKIVDYLSHFLSEQEEEILRSALDKGTIYLSSSEITLLSASLSKEEILARMERTREKEPDEQKEKTERDELVEIVTTCTSASQILKALLALRQWDMDDLVGEARCGVAPLTSFLHDKGPLSERLARSILEVLEIRQPFSDWFFEAFTTLHLPVINLFPYAYFFPPIMAHPTIIDLAFDFLRENSIYFQLIFQALHRQNPENYPILYQLFSTASPPAPEPPPVERPKSFGEQLRELRLSKSWTQKELARRVGCSDTCIRNAEKGNNIPWETVIRKMARAIGLSNQKKADFYEAAGVSYY